MTLSLSSGDDTSNRLRQMVENVGALDMIRRDADVEEEALPFLEGYYRLPNYVTVPVPERVENVSSRSARTVPERIMRLRGAEWAAKGRNHSQLRTDC